jgi:hypothetical protein
MERNEIYEVLQFCEEHGLHFSFARSDGVVWISTEDVVNCIFDPIGFAAEKNGVSRELYIEYKRWYDEQGPCSGITIKGKPCKAGCRLVTMQDYIPGESDLCRLHKGQARRVFA